jgi:CDP-glycerol glycerophosphotransferase (TagB/SpsB family)
MLELTEQKADDMNAIVAKSLEPNQTHSEGFELIWYLNKVNPKLTEDYVFHLHSLMKYYNEKYNRNWVTLGDRTYVRANKNTGYFYNQGGYRKILELETREQNIKELTEKQLQKSIWQIKGWWIFVLVNAIISFLIAWLTKE